MLDKSTNFVANPQHIIHQLPAGLIQGDTRTELFGCRKTKRVFVLSNGQTVSFKNLNQPLKALILQKMLADEKAMLDLRHLAVDDALENFAFCVFGSADAYADFDEKGNLKEGDNFICGKKNCTCYTWASKKISVDGNELTPREIEIVQLFASDLADKQIADLLHISVSTLNSHKSNIFDKFSVNSKSGLTRKAIEQKIVQ